MGRHDQRDRDEEDDSVDHELPDESDMDEDDDPPLVPCPYCRRPISEEAEICPHCGNFVSIEDGRTTHQSWVIATAVVVLVGIVLAWVLLRK